MPPAVRRRSPAAVARCGEDQAADDERGDRVGPLPAGDRDRRCCQQDGHGADGVVDDLEEGRAHVHVVRAGAHEQGDRGAVAHQADETEHDHRGGGHLGRLDQATYGLHDDKAAHREQDGRLSRGGEHLGAQEAPRARGRGRTAGQNGGTEGKAQTEDVRQHVTGVGEQGEASGDDRTDHLDDEDGRGDAENGRQPAR